MDFSASLHNWGTKDFNDSVQAQLTENEWQMPLENFCEGGGPDNDSLAHFTVDAVEEQDSEIVVTASVYFQESIPTGCRDVNFKERRQGKLIVTIDKTTGAAEVVADPNSERFNPEYY